MKDNDFKNPKEAVEFLFQELYDSQNDIWCDVIFEAINYLADQFELTDIIKRMSEDLKPSDICVINKSKAANLMIERLDSFKRKAAIAINKELLDSTIEIDHDFYKYANIYDKQKYS